MANSKGNTVDFNKAKNKSDTLKLLKKLRIPIAIILIASILSVTYSAMGKTRRSNISDTFRAIPATFGESPGYPYTEDDMTVSKLMLVGDKPLVVSDAVVQVLSQDADLLNELYPDWSDTKINSRNGRALAWCNTSGKAYLISRTDILNSYDEDGLIVTGAVGSNGSVALSSTSDSVQSKIKVYSPAGKVRFQWNCTKDYVSSLSLSPDGKKVLISAVGVENARLYSRVILFRTDKSKPEFDITLKGTTILKVEYCGKNKLVAVGDNQTIVYNSKGSKSYSFSYADDALYAVDNDSNGNVIICCKEYGGSKIKIVTIPSSGKKNYEFEISYTPSSVDIKDKKIAVALDNTVTVYTPEGLKKEVVTCSSNVSTVLQTSSCIYTLESGAICQYK